MAKRGLGKGLGALITEKPLLDSMTPGEKITVISLAEILPNVNQPRRSFEPEKLKELSASIAEKGIIQPIIVRPLAEATYEIVAGERRWRAAKLAGLKDMPCLVRQMDDQQVLETALVENIQRQDLDAMEEAESFKKLMEDHAYTQEELAEKVGKSRSYIANAVRLLNLPPEVKEFIRKGELSAGHGRALLSLNNTAQRKVVAKKMVVEHWSVRQSELYAQKQNQLAKEVKSDLDKKIKPKSEMEPLLAAIAERMRQRLGTKVSLTATGKEKGKIVVEYFSTDELNRLLEIILPGEEF